jgi:hypothetical protein
MLQLVQYPIGTYILGIDSNLSIYSVYTQLMLNRNPVRVSP